MVAFSAEMRVELTVYMLVFYLVEMLDEKSADWKVYAKDIWRVA